MKISRRALAQLALGGAAVAQQAGSGEQELALKQIQDNVELLRKQEVAMSTEPAFMFKA